MIDWKALVDQGAISQDDAEICKGKIEYHGDCCWSYSYGWARVSEDEFQAAQRVIRAIVDRVEIAHAH